MSIVIENITEPQKIALEDIFRTWMSLGERGSSRWTAFYADGDGNFRPKITIDGRQPTYTDLVKAEDKTVNLVHVNGENLTFRDTYIMDFDKVAWAMNDLEPDNSRKEPLENPMKHFNKLRFDRERENFKLKAEEQKQKEIQAKQEKVKNNGK